MDSLDSELTGLTGAQPEPAERPSTPPLPENIPRPCTPPGQDALLVSPGGGKELPPCIRLVRVRHFHQQDSESVGKANSTRLLTPLLEGELIAVTDDADDETAWLGGFRVNEPSSRGWFPRYYVERYTGPDPRLTRKDGETESWTELCKPRVRGDGASPRSPSTELFERFDLNGDGKLDSSEVKELCNSLFQHIDPDVTISEDDHDVLFQLFSSRGGTREDGSGNKVVDKASMEAMWDAWFNPDTISKPRSALIIVDVQNDFIDGTLGGPGRDVVVPKINALRERMHFDVVAHTQDFHPHAHCSFYETWDAEPFSTREIPAPDGTTMEQVMWPRHCVQGTHGTAFHADLTVLDTDLIVHKGVHETIDSYSGFFDNWIGPPRKETQMRNLLLERRISQVYVVGIAYDFCVGSTAFDANECGFKTCVLKDLTAAIAPAGEPGHEAMTAKLEGAGVHIVEDSAAIENSCVFSEIDSTPTDIIEMARKLMKGGGVDTEMASHMARTMSTMKQATQPLSQ